MNTGDSGDALMSGHEKHAREGEEEVNMTRRSFLGAADQDVRRHIEAAR